MAGRGAPPKDPDKRARDSSSPRLDEMLDLEEDQELRGDPLPPAGFSLLRHVRDEDKNWVTVREDYDWPPETQKWWHTWRRSAIAQTFLESDWDFLLETARLHAQFWLGDTKVAGELRLRVAKFGATPEDRLRLRLNVTKPVDPKSPQQDPPQPKSSQTYDGLRVVA